MKKVFFYIVFMTWYWSESQSYLKYGFKNSINVLPYSDYKMVKHTLKILQENR